MCVEEQVEVSNYMPFGTSIAATVQKTRRQLQGCIPNSQEMYVRLAMCECSKHSDDIHISYSINNEDLMLPWNYV